MDKIINFNPAKKPPPPTEDAEVAGSCEALAQFLKENRASIQSFICAVDNGSGDYRIFTTPITGADWALLLKLLDIRLNRNLIPGG